MSLDLLRILLQFQCRRPDLFPLDSLPWLVPAAPQYCNSCESGTASLSISNLLVFSSDAKPAKPVTLPPGRARLATRPSSTGFVEVVLITMGMVVVASFAANGVGPPEVTIRSTLRRTKSAASPAKRSFLCSANRYSMVIFFPSIHPSLRSSCRKTSKSTGATGSSAIIQETYAGDFRWLLPVGSDSKKTRTNVATKIDDQPALFIAPLVREKYLSLELGKLRKVIFRNRRRKIRICSRNKRLKKFFSPPPPPPPIRPKIELNDATDKSHGIESSGKSNCCQRLERMGLCLRLIQDSRLITGSFLSAKRDPLVHTRICSGRCRRSSRRYLHHKRFGSA